MELCRHHQLPLEISCKQFDHLPWEQMHLWEGGFTAICLILPTLTKNLQCDFEHANLWISFLEQQFYNNFVTRINDKISISLRIWSFDEAPVYDEIHNLT